MNISSIGSSSYPPTPEAVYAVNEALSDGSGDSEEILATHAQDFAMEAGIKVASVVLDTIKLNDAMILKLLDSAAGTVDISV